MAAKKEDAVQDQLRVNEKKWSKELMAAGFTVIPSIILERQKALGLDPLDINIIAFLSTYWWKADGLPRPSKKTIGEAVGRDPRTVQRRIARLEKAGMIRRIERRDTALGSRPNEYEFTGLIEEAKPFAVEKVREREAAAAAKAAKVAKKGKPKLALVKSD